jgi:hypothetical protein
LQLRFILGERGERGCVSRGSPFQLPTRLADGLGLESGLGARCREPFAPSQSLGNLVPPHPTSGRKLNLGCNPESKSRWRDFVKLAVKPQKYFAKRRAKAS